MFLAWCRDRDERGAGPRARHFAKGGAGPEPLGVRIQPERWASEHHSARFIVGCVAPPWGPQAAEVAEAFNRDSLGALARLTGEFSAAIVDLEARTLFAFASLTSREPIAFSETSEGVIVSTRVLSVVRSGWVSGKLDETLLHHIVTGLPYPDAGTTAIERVRRLRPGEAIIASEGRAQLVTIDRFGGRSVPHASRAACIEAFWESLTNATEQRARTAAQACLALSGGLDSTAVAVALGRASRPSPAFSIVAQGRPDEERPVRAIERALNIRATRIDCNEALDLGVLEELDLRDDPVLVGLSLVPADVDLLRRVRALGFDTLFEGEGGDELLSLNVSPLDALRQGHLAAAASLVLSNPKPRATLWRSVVLPHMPPTARALWYRRWAQSPNLLPGHMQSSLRSQPWLAPVVRRQFDAMVHRPHEEGFRAWLGAPVFLGSRVAHERAARHIGVQIAAPIVDRNVVETVLGMPPHWLLSRRYDKALLRRALKGYVPDDVRLRPKDNGLVHDMSYSVLGAPRTRALLADTRVRQRVEGLVRFSAVEGILEDLARGYRPPPNLTWQLECLVSFAEWYGRASREYGVD